MFAWYLISLYLLVCSYQWNLSDSELYYFTKNANTESANQWNKVEMNISRSTVIRFYLSFQLIHVGLPLARHILNRHISHKEVLLINCSDSNEGFVITDTIFPHRQGLEPVYSFS